MFNRTDQMRFAYLIGCILLCCSIIWACTQATPNTLKSQSTALKKIHISELPSFRTQAELPCADHYYIRVFNIDDTGYVYVNVNQFTVVGYQQDTGFLDITSLLNAGNNQVQLQVWNGPGGYTWGFQLKKNDELIFNEVAGQAGSYGANDNDQSSQNQFVYEHTVELNVCPSSGEPEDIDQQFCKPVVNESGKTIRSCFTCPSGQQVVFKNGEPVGCTGGIANDHQTMPFGETGPQRAFSIQSVVGGTCTPGGNN